MEINVAGILSRLQVYHHHTSSIRSRLSDDADLDSVISAVEVLSKETSLTIDEWTKLFLRRLNRTLTWAEYICNCGDTKDEDETFIAKDSWHFWMSYREDCHCILEHRLPQDDPVLWSKFTHTIEFENELKKRQQQFEEEYGTRKTMRELCDTYKDFLKEYLDNCISFHSTLPVRGLTSENVIQAAQIIYGREGVVSFDLAQNIAEKINIPLQSPISSLAIGDVGVLEGDRSIKPNQSDFIPSGEDIFVYLNGTVNVPFFLEKYRWSVILGDPGGGKTTLLRWILLQAIHDFPNEEKQRRLPILIRIGELSRWLEVQPSTVSLFDYIGRHTWFGSPYAHEKYATAILQFVLHGQATLLFDGLDEVSDYTQRQKIVCLIEKFVEDYVQTPGNISVNDDSATIADLGGLFCESPVLVQGNQIIVTSRMVGYRLFPLTGKQFERFILRELTDDDAKTFINNWFLEVNYAIKQTIESFNLVKSDNKTKSLLIDKQEIIHSFLQGANEKIWSHPALLSLILPFVHKQSAEKTLTSRILLYETTVKTALIVSFTFDPSIHLDLDTNAVNCVLYDMADHLHHHCPSGLVDTFDLKRLSFISLRTFYKRKNISLPFNHLESLVEQFIQKLNSNAGFVAALGLGAYGFVHRTFQEYFMAISIVNPLCDDMQLSPISMSERVFSHVMKENFREPLALAIGCINSHWLSEEFDLFCISLMEKTVHSVPVGVILLFDVFEECSNALSEDIMRRVFNCVFISSGNSFLWNNVRERFDRSVTSQNIVKALLNRGVCVQQLSQFLFGYFNDRNELYPYPGIPPWLSEPEFLELLFSDECDEGMETMKDMAARTLALKENFHSNVLAEYMLEQNINISEMHVSVLLVIIALCGGIRLVEITENEEYSMEFDTSDMYRETPLSKIFIEYFADDQTEDTVRLQNLTQKCEEILSNSHKDDLSRRVVDACVALICLRGVGCPVLYQRFGSYLSLKRALYRLKLVFNDLREQYKFIIPKWKLDKNILNISEEFLFDLQKPESVALAMCAAYQRMTLISIQKAVPLGYNFDSDRFSLCSTRFLKIFGNLYLDDQNDDIETSEEGKHPYQLLQNHPLFLVAFVSLCLQPLFERLVLTDRLDKRTNTYENETVPYIVLLSEVLLQLHSVQNDTGRSLLLLEVLNERIQLYEMSSYSNALIYLAFLEGEEKDNFELPKLTVEELLQRENNRCYDAQNISNTKQADLQLYTASISIACLSQLTENRKEFFEQAKVAARTIHNVYLRILCFRHIKEIVRHWVDTTFYHTIHEELFIEINRLSLDMPLLMSALLVTMCMENGEQFHSSFRRFADSLWTRVQAISADEKEARDQEAAYLSCKDVFHFEVPPSFLDRPNLSTILQMNSPAFTGYFKTEEILDESEKVILAQMYLTELAIDAQILSVFTPFECKSNRLNIIKIQLGQLWTSLSSSKNDYLFPHRGITMIHVYLQQQLSDIVEIPFDKLLGCNGFETRDRPVIEGWLSYKTDKYRTQFAYLAVFLLIRQGDMTSTIQTNVEEILRKSLLSPIDSIRQAAQAGFVSRYKDFINLKCVAWTEPIWYTLKKFYMNAYNNKHDYEAIRFIGFDLISVEALDVLLNLERKRIYSQKERNVDDEYHNVTFFLMIDGLSDNIRENIETRLYALIDNLKAVVDPLFDQYLSSVLLYIIPKFWDVRFSEYLFELLVSLLDQVRFPLTQQAAALILAPQVKGKEVLIRYVSTRSDIRLDEKISDIDKVSSDQTIVACLRGMMNSTLDSKIDSENWQKVCLQLRSSYEVNSAIAWFATACVLSSTLSNEKAVDNFTRKFGVNVHTLYVLLKIILISKADRSGHLEVDTIVSLIDQQCKELIGEFVNDFLDCLYGKNPSWLDIFGSSTKVFLKVAYTLLRPRRIEIMQAIREKTSEERFMNALYCFYKKAHFNERKICVQLYSAFDILTSDFITMIFQLTLESFDEIDMYKFVKNADGRDCIELIFPYLQSESMIQRYYAAKWLAHLFSCHILSATEVQTLLGNILEDPSSSQLIYIPSGRSRKSLHNHIQYILLGMTCLDPYYGPEKFLTVEEVEANFLEVLDAF